MTISTFSLPIDIPWRRIAFSSDMMDEVACDRILPLRWRSSLAVFEYEPPQEQQRQDGFKVSYIKVACTITGYQPAGKEIRIRERLGRAGWTQGQFATDAISAYYACHGAMLEVVVAPHADDRAGFAHYPYFADFDPKKRELYENVTDTGEVMSRTLEDVNVRLGQTTLQSHEMKDTTNLGASLSGSYGGVTAAGSVSNESGTTDLSQQGTENVRTTDAAREARETYSHTTQLSQMYHQLDSYHLGTNRAAFFLMPRPHTVESPRTFVNGPREIEGIQEFMLVIVRPDDMDDYCIEAYLETAHLTRDPILDWGETDVQLVLPKISAPVTEDDDRSYFNNVTGSAVTPARAGYVIDESRGGAGYGGNGGYDLNPSTYHAINLTSFDFIVGKEQVTVNGLAQGFWDNNSDTLYPASLELTATVYQKKTAPTVAGYSDRLLITARSICSCSAFDVTRVPYDRGVSVVYEKPLKGFAERGSRERQGMPIIDANRLGGQIRYEMMSSIGSPDRYPRGEVGLLDTQLIAGAMGSQIRHAAVETNPRLADVPGVNPDMARRLAAFVPAITRAELLEMRLIEQTERFGLSITEAVELRRILLGLEAPDGPPSPPERQRVDVPRLTGMSLPEANRVLIAAGLVLGGSTETDNSLPAGVIVEQSLPAGAAADAGSSVEVTVASGLSVRIPDLSGRSLCDAIRQLHDAGLRCDPRIEGQASARARVAEQEPAPGTLVTPNGEVTLHLRSRRAPDHG